MKLFYYYTNDCSSCREYEAVAEQLAIDFAIDEVVKVDVSKELAMHKLKGIPTIIIENDAGTEVFRSLGNTPIKYVREAYEQRGTR